MANLRGWYYGHEGSSRHPVKVPVFDMLKGSNYTLVESGKASWQAVDLCEVKHLIGVVDEDRDDDIMIKSFVDTATHVLEKYTDLITVQRIVKLKLLRWWNFGIEFPKFPVQSITSIKYYDSAGVQQTWAVTEYQSDLDHRMPLIAIAPDKQFPQLETGGRLGAVEVEVVAGYANEYSVPAPIKDALKMGVNALYLHRGMCSEGDVYNAMAPLLHNLTLGYGAI